MPQPWQLGPVSDARVAGIDPEMPAVATPASAPTKTESADVLTLASSADRHTHAAPAPARAPEKAPAPASFMPAPRRRTQSPRSIVIGLSAAAAVVIAITGFIRYRSTAQPAAAAVAPPASQGDAMIISRPEGAQILVDGIARGVTPLKLSLPVGEHALELQNGSSTRTLSLTIDNGSLVREYVDLSPNAASGRLEVTSDPPGAQVTVDGAPRGVTPLVIASVDAGQHKIAIAQGETTVNRTVSVAAGATATVMASLVPSGAAAGWVSIKAPFEMEILEGGKMLGTTSADRLMLPAGRHDLDLVAAPLEFKTTLTVQIAAGKTAAPAVVLPKGVLSINALPWADVWLDGQPIGATPIGNLSVPIGSHDIVWRHPQLGERRQTVKVTAQSPVRAGVDLSK